MPAHCAHDTVAFLAHETLHFIGSELLAKKLKPDYKVWGQVKEGMCHTLVRDVNNLKQRLIDMWSWSGMQSSHLSH